ncbi:MAG: hypothetical protein ACK48U_14455 [Planctomyces sp.]
MISGTTALFVWTLRADNRSVWPHVVRGAFAFMMLFTLSLAWTDAFGTTRIGLRFFETICSLNILIISVAGISYFSTAVTEEKDAGTLALLQLAGMSPLAITLGKSTSRLVSSLMLLAVQVPFSFLAVTLGGVLWQQLLAAWCALAAWLILVANAALLCSARCSTSGRAAAVAGSSAILFFLLPAVTRTTTAAIPPGILPQPVMTVLTNLPGALEIVSPLKRIDQILNNWQNTGFFGSQFTVSILMAATCFAVSTCRLTAWARHVSDSESLSGPTKRRLPVERCWKLPLTWRDFHFYTGGWPFFTMKFLAGFAVYASFVAIQQVSTDRWNIVLEQDFGWTAMLVFASVLTVEVLLYSSGSLFSELRQSTQSTIAMTPCSTVSILLQKAAGCLIAVLPAVFWSMFTLAVSRTSVLTLVDMDTIVVWGLMLIFSSHVAALFSLYTRWAALPLTVLVSFFAFFVIAGPVLTIPDVVDRIAITHNYRPSRAFAWTITAFWTWLFTLLPLQLWIRDQWIKLSRQ